MFKKDDSFIKKIYRPVSVLNSHSKIFEYLIHYQLSEHFENILMTTWLLSEKGFDCQATLLRHAEDWRRDLDNQLYVGVVLTDLSKAFDCLPHALIVDKLAAYGLFDSACKLLAITVHTGSKESN